MITLIFYISVLIFWGIPIAFGAGFWQVTALYAGVVIIRWVVTYEY